MRLMDKAAIACLLLAVITLLALFLVNSTDAEGAPGRVSLRQVERLAERDMRLPHGLLARHRRYERARARCYSRAWNDGRGAVCGRNQISIHDITHPDGARLAALARTKGGNAWAIAMIMDHSRRWCAARPGKCACPWALVNWFDQDRLCAALASPDA